MLKEIKCINRNPFNPLFDDGSGDLPVVQGIASPIGILLALSVQLGYVPAIWLKMLFLLEKLLCYLLILWSFSISKHVLYKKQLKSHYMQSNEIQQHSGN
jgi:hypothetical protein